jgi:hypothetical protein
MSRIGRMELHLKAFVFGACRRAFVPAPLGESNDP